MKKLALLLLLVVPLLVPPQASALCDIGGGRVIHTESSPFSNTTTLQRIYWVAPSVTAPTFYYVFTSTNQSFINLLDAALISGKQVRVTGNVAACGAAGTLRAGGVVVAVFMDSFQ
jgi:hypothetical protein